jgi:hypothetical protein
MTSRPKTELAAELAEQLDLDGLRAVATEG